MFVSRRRFASFVGTLLMVALPMTAAYAYADSNTMGAPVGGEGSGGVSGFAASNIHYDHVEGNPALIEGVSFSLDQEPPAGSTLEASLDGGTSWSACAASGVQVECSVATAVAEVEELRLVATQ